jgi:porphobilinogen synthase
VRGRERGARTADPAATASPTSPAAVARAVGRIKDAIGRDRDLRSARPRRMLTCLEITGADQMSSSTSRTAAGPGVSARAPAEQPAVRGAFPTLRPRRLRRTNWMRRLVSETRLSADDLIWSIVVKPGKGGREPIPSMPGVFRLTPDEVVRAAEEAVSLNIPALALFAYTELANRTADGRLALDRDNAVNQAARAVRKAKLDIGLISDVALDTYTTHGHDGLLDGDTILNDETLAVLTRQALGQAEAGFDIIAPSDMMDGRVGAIRAALDRHGFQDVAIMSYAAKYASAFYAPYRDAVGSTPALKGDKRTYQMDPANTNEALREVALDIGEGADMVMVKPGTFYLDIVHRVKAEFGLPTFAFQVSGEYSMIMAAVEKGWLDGDRVIPESLLAFKRAGADGILTYFAPRVARQLQARG